MRTYENGIYRDMTEEEIEEFNKYPKDSPVCPEEVLSILLGGEPV